MRPQTEIFNQIQYICHLSYTQFYYIFRRCIDLTRDSCMQWLQKMKRKKMSFRQMYVGLIHFHIHFIYFVAICLVIQVIELRWAC